jgi:O-antigen/teichoic acid export membrane protein
VGTWSVALLVRLYLPRHLGPHDFGVYSFAEGIAATAIAFLTLGVDSYTLRELPTRPAHASDYFGGMLVVRAGLGALLVAGLCAAMAATGRGAQLVRLVAVFALGHLILGAAQLFAAGLQAGATVARLAVVNVAAKIVWGAVIALALALRAPLELVAGALVLSEALKAALLWAESRSKLGLTLRVDLGSTLAVIVASVPFFAHTVALSLNRLDVTVLGFLAGAQEVGWYGAASMFSLLVVMFAPLMSSVVLPMLARVRARSEAEFVGIMERLTQALIIVATPLALIVALGADLWVRLAFGEAYRPAAVSLRVLAVLALLSYFTSLTSMALVTLGRRWRVTLASVAGLVVNPLLCFVLIPVAARRFGPGGAGAGAALGVVGMEVTILALQLRAPGLGVAAPRVLRTAARCALASALAVGVHIGGPGPDHVRLLLAAGAYALAAFGLGVLPVRQVAKLARELLDSRTAPAPSR